MSCYLIKTATRVLSLIRLGLILLGSLLCMHAAYATNLDHLDSATNKAIKFNVQLGLDAWDLKTPDRSNAPLKGVDRLYLANSYTQWSYRNPSAWIKTSGQWDISSNLSLTYKARADQSVGTQLDDLNFDYRLSPKLGFRAGVLDYKTSWCRTYETDSPWIQEIDPFCTNPVTNESTLAAPGVQAYLTFAPSNYLIQGLVGIYRPKAFKYNENEFSNVANTKGVAVNNRWGWSVNALNLDNASEFRLSWLAARQENNRDSGGYRGQEAGALFMGASFYPIEKLNIRLSLFNSLVRQASYDSPPEYTQILENSMVRKSSVVEMIYQVNSLNTLGLSLAKYTNNWNLTGMNGYQAYTNPNYYRFTREGQSLAWRRDWSQDIHTSVQWVKSTNNQELAKTTANAKGTALGLRIGLTY